ncbi:MAG: hypothetical protein ABIS01_00090, partial [Ferruginibacter sp.]
MIKPSLISVLSILLVTTSNCQVLADSNKNKNETSKSPVDKEEKIFEKVEREAEFPGGVKAWIKYLQENLDADVPVKKKARVGT